MRVPLHQYIDRDTAMVKTERLYADRLLHWMYAAPWEDSRLFYKLLSSAYASRLLSLINYELPLMAYATGLRHFVWSLNIDLSECLEPQDALKTPRAVFERKLRYWEVRPMEANPVSIVSPADARVLFGSFSTQTQIFLKAKWFDLEELLGPCHPACWAQAFQSGDFAVFRLTPDKYHYNHTPVAGIVCDFYEIDGQYHSCNPCAVVVATPYSKNKRVVTIINTDVPHGTGMGLVAMIEIVALMIGRIDQCYSIRGYDDPQPLTAGLFLQKGQPKSRYRPGSSTDILIFQRGRFSASADLLENLVRTDVQSRFSQGLGRPLAETDVKVRSTIGHARRRDE